MLRNLVDSLCYAGSICKDAVAADIIHYARSLGIWCAWAWVYEGGVGREVATYVLPSGRLLY